MALHFFNLLFPATTWNDFLFKPSSLSCKFNSLIVAMQFTFWTPWNNREMIAITRSYIFRRCSRCLRHRFLLKQPNFIFMRSSVSSAIVHLYWLRLRAVRRAFDHYLDSSKVYVFVFFQQVPKRMFIPLDGKSLLPSLGSVESAWHFTSALHVTSLLEFVISDVRMGTS